jgi:hypothetical protein
MKNLIMKYLDYVVVAVVSSIISVLATLNVLNTISSFKRDVILWATICAVLVYIICRIIIYLKKKKE